MYNMAIKTELHKIGVDRGGLNRSRRNVADINGLSVTGLR
jgi:hypothetical protein